MRKLFLLFCTSLFFLILGCKTIEKKSESILKKENLNLSKFLNKPVSELKMVLGKPDKISINVKGFTILIYIKKKYNIKCERQFEVNENNLVIGFSSKGCF